MHSNNLKIMVFALFVFLGTNAFCQTPPVKINSYDVKVNLDLPNNQLQIATKLGLQKSDTVSRLEMLLNSDVKIKSIKSKINDDWINLPYEFAGKDTLRLAVPSRLASRRELTLDFEYTFPLGKSKEEVMVFDRGLRWYPFIPDQIVRFKLTADVPPEYVVFAAGDLIEKKTSLKYSQFIWESKIPVFKLPLIIAQSNFYDQTVKKCGGKEIYFYSFSVDKEIKEKILSEACSTLKFYNEFIGEYPHHRLTLIETPEIEGTNIGSALLMIGTTFIDAFKQGQYENLQFSIACQWMATGVFFEFLGKGFWFLQLSFPHSLRLMYLEKVKGKDAFIQGLTEGLDAYKEFAGTDKDVPIIDVDYPNTKEKGRVIYGKGPYVFDQVRRQIGDENWHKLIRDIYKDFKGRIITYDEFIDYLSRYDRDGTCVSKLEKMLSKTGLPED
jgi:hypothetical protein